MGSPNATVGAPSNRRARKDRFRKKRKTTTTAAVLNTLISCLTQTFFFMCVQLLKQSSARETTDLLLEPLTFLRGEGVCFGDQGDDVHFLVQPFHKLNIQWLQSVGRREPRRSELLAVRFVWLSASCPDVQSQMTLRSDPAVLAQLCNSQRFKKLSKSRSHHPDVDRSPPTTTS